MNTHPLTTSPKALSAIKTAATIAKRYSGAHATVHSTPAGAVMITAPAAASFVAWSVLIAAPGVDVRGVHRMESIIAGVAPTADTISTEKSMDDVPDILEPRSTGDDAPGHNPELVFRSRPILGWSDIVAQLKQCAVIAKRTKDESSRNNMGCVRVRDGDITGVHGHYSLQYRNNNLAALGLGTQSLILTPDVVQLIAALSRSKNTVAYVDNIAEASGAPMHRRIEIRDGDLYAVLTLVITPHSQVFPPIDSLYAKYMEHDGLTDKERRAESTPRVEVLIPDRDVKARAKELGVLIAARKGTPGVMTTTVAKYPCKVSGGALIVKPCEGVHGHANISGHDYANDADEYDTVAHLDAMYIKSLMDSAAATGHGLLITAPEHEVKGAFQALHVFFIRRDGFTQDARGLIMPVRV